MPDLGEFVSHDMGALGESQFIQPAILNSIEQLTAKWYSVTGTILDKNGIPAQRKVIAIRESNWVVEDITESDPITGMYTAKMETMEPHTLVFTGESERNAIVFSGVIPNE